MRVAVTKEINPDFQSKHIMSALEKMPPQAGYTCSHILFIHDDSIYHCTGRGVTKDSLSEFLKTHVIVKEKEIKFFNGNLDQFIGFNEALIEMNVDYSEGQFVGFLFPHLEKYVKDGRSELVCSEYAGWTGAKYFGSKYKEDYDFLDPIESFEGFPCLDL